MDVIHQTPQIVLIVDLRLKRRHAGASAFADATEHFTVGGAVLIGLGIGQVCGVGHDVDLGLAVGSVASDAVADKYIVSLCDGLLAVGNRILELFRVSDTKLAILTGERPGSQGGDSKQEPCFYVVHRGFKLPRSGALVNRLRTDRRPAERVKYHGGVNAYDQVLYENSPVVSTHPGRLFVMAKLAGLQPAPVEKCRVLELGTNAGRNLIGMAIALPGAEFVGVELAEIPVTHGREMVANLGLRNVRLERMSVLDIDEGFGRFDYIIAHGLYSWVPAAVRDKILAVARANMNPHGMAFVSYNTFPGCHLRVMLREMMLYHIGAEDDPVRKLDRARELLRVLASGRPEMDAQEAALAAEAAACLERGDSALYHDDLSACFEPVYFHEFAAHAARHNLQFAGEAHMHDSLLRNLKPETIAAMQEFAGGDRIAQQQYMDFARSLRFRRTLLCHAEISLSEGNAEGCHASCSASETENGTFVGKGGQRVTTGHPAAVEYLRRLISLWPLSEPVLPGKAGLAVELFRTGIIELRGYAGVARNPGERPCASTLARYQAASGEAKVISLGLRLVELGDAAVKKLLGLLDGSRNLEQLRTEMNCEPEQLDVVLKHLAACELLVG